MAAATEPDLQKALRSVTAYKGHFTRLLKAIDRLIDFAPTAAIPSVAGNLQLSLDKLEDIHSKLDTSIDEVFMATDDEEFLDFWNFLHEQIP